MRGCSNIIFHKLAKIGVVEFTNSLSESGRPDVLGKSTKHKSLKFPLLSNGYMYIKELDAI